MVEDERVSRTNSTPRKRRRTLTTTDVVVEMPAKPCKFCRVGNLVSSGRLSSHA